MVTVEDSTFRATRVLFPAKIYIIIHGLFALPMVIYENIMTFGHEHTVSDSPLGPQEFWREGYYGQLLSAFSRFCDSFIPNPILPPIRSVRSQNCLHSGHARFAFNELMETKLTRWTFHA